MFARFNRYYIFAFGLLILLVAIFISVIIISLTESGRAPSEGALPGTRPSPTPPQPLHPREEAYNEAKPQEFYSEGSNKTGTLVVTATTPEVRVMIDDGEAEGPVGSKPYPIQITPFRVTDVPVGEHLLRAAKPGYIMTEIPFTVSEDGITRIQITLRPIVPVN
jgi:hypothetical protein